MGRGKRYDTENKLNLKKVFAVIIALAVIVMFIMVIKNLVSEAKDTRKTVAVNFYALYSDNKWGVLGGNGEPVIEPMYKEMIIVLNKAQDVFLCTYDVDSTTGEYKTKVVNRNNQEIFTEYDKVEALENYDKNGNVWYEENLLRILKDGKYGIIDINGKQIVGAEYDSIETLKGVKNSLIIRKDGKLGLINNSGTVVVEPNYSSIQNIDEDYKHGYIVTDSNNKKGIISYTGNKLIDIKYDDILRSYNENYFAVKEGKTQILINAEGKNVLTSSNNYDSIEQVNSDGIVFTKNKKFGFMDLDGKIAIKADYDDLKEINTGILRAKKGDKYGLIDLTGAEKLAFTYNDIAYQEKANIYIAENNSYISNIMDSNFDIKLTGIVSELNLTDGFIKIKMQDEYKYYNFKFEEKDVKDILVNNNLFVKKQDGKYGYVDKQGKNVVDYIYDEALEQNSQGFAAIKQNGLWGAIDSQGNVVVAPKYKLDNNLVIDFIGKWHLGQDLNMNYYLNW